MRKLKIREEFNKNFPNVVNEINSDNYNFLDTKENILFLTLGGSYAYGTNIEGSDIDIRGVSLNNKEEILLFRDSEQFINEATDTVIYTSRKIIELLARMNPNVIEILGSVERNALYIHPYFENTILKSKELFLSKTAMYTFGGYAAAQLNRLNNKLGRTDEEVERENIIRSIKTASTHLKERYDVDLNEDMIFSQNKNGFSLEIKDLSKEKMSSCLNEIATIFKDYSKLGKRNKNAIEGNKINKHAMHLVRLYLMAIDILEKGEINTYREKDHDLLMSIRYNEDNKWIKDNRLTSYAEKYVDELENKMKIAFDNSKLPDKPDMNKINELVIKINTDIINDSLRG